MAKADLKGIRAVLSGLSAEKAQMRTEPERVEKQGDPEKMDAGDSVALNKTASTKQKSSRYPEAGPVLGKVVARLGRPPGRKAGDGPLKKKTSLFVSAELMDRYVEWSWEERCNLGTLVERALADYLKGRRRADKVD